MKILNKAKIVREKMKELFVVEKPENQEKGKKELEKMGINRFDLFTYKTDRV